jgi:uncharacterized protein YjdB
MMNKKALLFFALTVPAWSAGISIYPPSISLTGRNATQVVVVSAGERDVTAECSFQVADAGIASVSEAGLITASADGQSKLTASCAGEKTQVSIKVASASEEPKLSFVKDVVPIFTMAGCAGSNCHGSIRGQNGFKLSLFGYEPSLDYEAIGPRIDKESPEKSLILTKPTFQAQHGGGIRFPVDSLEYRTILEWIKGGASYDSEGSPRIESLSVFPEDRVLDGVGSTQQLVATATYSDGTSRDVTHLVQYSSNNPDTVQVTADGKVTGLQVGETAIMVRTLGQAVAAKIYVPRPALTKAVTPAPRNNFIDEHVFAKLERLHIEPSELSADSDFLRRVYLDTIGVLPTQKEAEEFLASNDPNKRDRVIDELVGRTEFAELWAMKFTELFRAGTREAGNKAARIIYEYMKNSIHEGKSYDQIVTELLLSQGPHLYGQAPSSFYNITFDSNAPDHATNISQLFLGTRIECAKCHNHPWEKWTQDDFYGFAAFFARVKIKQIHEDDENEHYYAEEGEVIHPKTKQASVPKYLDGALEIDEPEKDIRIPLAKWMTAPENPFFSRATVNRVWKHYFSRGLVEEVDDFRVTNPPTNPALLDALAHDFSSHGYDWRHLSRTILKSRTYQLGAKPTESNADDDLNYSRYYMRRLLAEQMVDTISQVTGVPERFQGFLPGTRAMQVYSSRGGSYMLTAFGRLNRDIICERDSTPDIVQTLHLISGNTINDKINKWEPNPSLSDEQQLNAIYLNSLTRYPSAEERERLLGQIQTRDRRAVFQDLLWAILNSKEFLYNH